MVNSSKVNDFVNNLKNVFSSKDHTHMGVEVIDLESIIEDKVHSILQEVLTGKIADVTLENGELKEIKFESDDL